MDPADATRHERDVLARLLDLTEVNDADTFLREALALVIARTGAWRGYLALLDAGDAARPRWWTAVAFDARTLDDLRGAVSGGVIGQALALGRPLRITNAALDPAWAGRASIQRNQVEGVLCCPIGPPPAVGVLYLQGHPGGGAFTADDEQVVSRICAWLAPQAARHRRRVLADATADVRARVDAPGIAGRGDATRRLLEEIEFAATSGVETVLLGPTGSGKTEIARAIWRNGPRASGPFVAWSCAVLPQGIPEVELFGAAPGAYTGAPPGGLPGLVGAAEGGVLFLDEVGELSPAAQALLLQVLDDDRTYRRVGDPRPRTADFLLVAATHHDLAREVDDGRFRRDLWHRMSTHVIDVPGLEARRDDIETIAEHLLERIAARRGHRRAPLSPAAAQALTDARWPGNVRELAKVLETAAIRAHRDGSPHVGLRHLYPGRADPDEGPQTWREATAAFQARLLRRTLEQAGWRVSDAARALDLQRQHLYELMARLGIERPSPEDNA